MRHFLIVLGLTLILPSAALAAAAAYTQFAINGGRFCGVLENGRIECTDSENPTHATLQPESDTTFTSVGRGNYYACGITTAGEVDCWGDETLDGELFPPAFDLPVVSLSVGPYHACALDNEGNVKCWGQNVHGQTDPPQPATNFVDVDAFGITNSCGVKNTGELVCWGQPNHNLLPDNPNTVSTSLVVDFESSGDISCVIRANGNAECWARVAPNQLIASFKDGPYQEVFAIRGSGQYPACALTLNGGLDCAQGPTQPNGQTTELPVTRLTGVYKDVHAHNQDVYGFTFENRLESIASNNGLPHRPIVDVINMEIDMPTLAISGGEYYGSELGTELFFQVLDTPSNTYVRKFDTQIFRDGELIATSDNFSSYVDNTTVEGAEHSYAVRAVHPFGQVGELSNAITVAATTSDQAVPVDPSGDTRPNAPTGLRAEIYWFDIELFWDRNTSGAVQKYEIRKNGELIATTRGTSWYDDTTVSGELYQFDVLAVDADNNLLGIESVRVQIGTAQCQ